MARSTDSASSSSDGESSTPDAPNFPKELKTAEPEVSPTQNDRSVGKKSEDRGRPARPKLTSRHSSSIIVPRSQANVVVGEEKFPPGDARAMSPRRNSDETEAMEEQARTAVRE